jgi:hypothetical protein
MTPPWPRKRAGTPLSPGGLKTPSVLYTGRDAEPPCFAGPVVAIEGKEEIHFPLRLGARSSHRNIIWNTGSELLVPRSSSRRDAVEVELFEADRRDCDWTRRVDPGLADHRGSIVAFGHCRRLLVRRTPPPTSHPKGASRPVQWSRLHPGDAW